MMRPAKWKIATFTAVFGGLHLLGVAHAMVKPHVAGNSAVSISAIAGAPLSLAPAVSRGCPDAGGSTTQSPTRAGLRGLRAATQGRAGGSVGLTAAVPHGHRENRRIE
jgi:hypothetical protein